MFGSKDPHRNVGVFYLPEVPESRFRVDLVWRGPTNIHNPSTGKKKIKINLEYKNIRFIFVLLNQYYYEI